MVNIRNVAIIAHVDHGKTTLVDALLKQTQTALNKEQANSTLIMDSNELEKERGITIFSKNASVVWHPSAGSGQATKINIIDTPGHADFGGEVERVLNLADGALLLIDAKEGPMPQTRFVLKRALEMGLKIIVVINKIDRPDARIDYVINKTFDLFIELGADEASAYFPIVYASAKAGLAGTEPNLGEMTDIYPIFKAILEHIPAPSGNPEKPLQMLVTTISGDNFKGRVATGRIYNGKITAGGEIIYINRAGAMKKYRLSSLMGFKGLGKVDIKEAVAGDIVAISGIPDITIGETIADTKDPIALPLLDIEEPTIKMTFSVNASPVAGREGEFKTSRQIKDRLFKELETDVALKVEDNGSSWVVSGRGELHLAILIERMRREGYEFQVARPKVIEKIENGIKLTPFERLYLEVPDDYAGVVMQKLGARRGKLTNMQSENGITQIEFIISTKDLFGYRSEFVTDTKGLGIFNALFLEFRPDNGISRERERGSLVVHENGISNLYALTGAQDRGTLFIGPGVPVYKGEVIGQNSRRDDIAINICKEKQQTNHRSSGEGVSEHFNTPKQMGLEEALEYIDDSELVEVTPKNIRIRKII
ncbi:MAG: translational GTPase TypA [Candidatus Daviesbacteria bacterium]|nr:MAG: translational GTPase TypA [Candidatus Daviesbacteria bacterium]